MDACRFTWTATMTGGRTSHRLSPVLAARAEAAAQAHESAMVQRVGRTVTHAIERNVATPSRPAMT